MVEGALNILISGVSFKRGSTVYMLNIHVVYKSTIACLVKMILHLSQFFPRMQVCVMYNMKVKWYCLTTAAVGACDS